MARKNALQIPVRCMYGRKARKTTSPAVPQRIPLALLWRRAFVVRPFASAAHFFRYVDQRVQAMKTTAPPVKTGRYGRSHSR